MALIRDQGRVFATSRRKTPTPISRNPYGVYSIPELQQNWHKLIFRSLSQESCSTRELDISDDDLDDLVVVLSCINDHRSVGDLTYPDISKAQLYDFARTIVQPMSQLTDLSISATELHAFLDTLLTVDVQYDNEETRQEDREFHVVLEGSKDTDVAWSTFQDNFSTSSVSFVQFA
jgi:hypothetical protein